MIRVIILFSLILFSESVVSQPLSKYTVNGDVEGLGDASLLLLKFIDDGVQFDSVKVNDNQFTFSGEIGEPYFVQILIKEGSSTSGKLTEFMLEASEIFIRGTEPDYDKVTVEGSKSDAVLKSYFADDDRLTTRWDSLKVFYDKAVEMNDSTARKQYAIRLNEITQVDRVELLKDYVDKNSDSTVGALLPIFCTIEDNLSKDDYKEFYDMLSSEAKKSGYGKVIRERSEED